MITLKKQNEGVHELTNSKAVVSIGAAKDSDTEGFSPVDYLCSSVSMCVALTLDAIIKRDRLPINGYSIEVNATKADDRPSRFEQIDLTIKFDGEIDDQTRIKLEKSAERGCTIGHTLEHGATVTITSK
ncbi:OsmC family protein [Amphibacillus sediminis]|uniref:OsmC family protein n=1 Tax=Amphibacillus sediminis TaxID=360185 RepID=UPI00082F7D82|nr:OsmC family protein [Amphibacillus sediminis]